MRFSDTGRFWAIFDTCTRPEYYLDVHKILALPKGAVVRYEYRDKYLSEQAKRAAINTANAPAKVLLIYGQKPGYMRGQGNEEAKASPEQIRWVATRLATMQLIPSTTGANFFFDFTVGDYPKPDEDILMRILKPLIRQRETPFTKWVAISDDISSYNELMRGEDETNWEETVDRLSAPDMQFRSDTFWRLRRLDNTEPKLLSETDETASEVRQVISRYELSGGDTCGFEVISHSPAGRPSNQPSRDLQVMVETGDAIVLEGSSKIGLRQYTGQILRFRAKPTEGDGTSTHLVRFETTSDQAEWPDGASFDLAFSISSEPVQTRASQPARKSGKNMDKQPDEDLASVASNASVLDKLKPWAVLQSAIRAVPAVRYALGVAGIAAAGAIAGAFFESPTAAMMGTLAVFVLMVLLVIFARATEKSRGLLTVPAIVLTWSLALLFVGSLALTATSVFFAYPMPYPVLVRQFASSGERRVTVLALDQKNQKPIIGAVVALVGATIHVKKTTEAGGKAVFDRIPVTEHRLVATVSAPGFRAAEVAVDASQAEGTYSVQLEPVGGPPSVTEPVTSSIERPSQLRRSLQDLDGYLSHARKIFNEQISLRNRLADRIKTTQPTIYQDFYGQGYNVLFYHAFPGFNLAESKLQAQIRQITLTSQRNANRSLQDWVDQHPAIRRPPFATAELRVLAQELDKLVKHLSGWWAGVEVVNQDERWPLSYMGDENKLGTDFPQGLEPAVKSVLQQLSE